MSTGIAVNPECLEALNVLKKSKTINLVALRTADNLKEIVVDKTFENATYDEVLEQMPENQCKWLIYDFPYEVEGGKRNKIVLISWVPDDATVKQKMIYAASKDSLKRSLDLVTDIQATDYSEVAHETVLAKITK